MALSFLEQQQRPFLIAAKCIRVCQFPHFARAGLQIEHQQSPLRRSCAIVFFLILCNIIICVQSFVLHIGVQQIIRICPAPVHLHGIVQCHIPPGDPRFREGADFPRNRAIPINYVRIRGANQLVHCLTGQRARHRIQLLIWRVCPLWHNGNAAQQAIFLCFGIVHINIAIHLQRRYAVARHRRVLAKQDIAHLFEKRVRKNGFHARVQAVCLRFRRRAQRKQRAQAQSSKDSSLHSLRLLFSAFLALCHWPPVYPLLASELHHKG